MRQVAGVVALVVAVATGLVGALWSFGKAFGTEWDVCNGSDCHSGWFVAAPLLAVAIASAAIGIRFLRSGRGSA